MNVMEMLPKLKSNGKKSNNLCILGLLCPSCIPTLFACRETEEKEKEISKSSNQYSMLLCYPKCKNVT